MCNNKGWVCSYPMKYYADIKTIYIYFNHRKVFKI